jgi:hypothetical protein
MLLRQIGKIGATRDLVFQRPTFVLRIHQYVPRRCLGHAKSSVNNKKSLHYRGICTIFGAKLPDNSPVRTTFR